VVGRPGGSPKVTSAAGATDLTLRSDESGDPREGPSSGHSSASELTDSPTPQIGRDQSDIRTASGLPVDCLTSSGCNVRNGRSAEMTIRHRRGPRLFLVDDAFVEQSVATDDDESARPVRVGFTLGVAQRLPPRVHLESGTAVPATYDHPIA
jgi:hypothetical protein